MAIRLDSGSGYSGHAGSGTWIDRCDCFRGFRPAASSGGLATRFAPQLVRLVVPFWRRNLGKSGRVLRCIEQRRDAAGLGSRRYRLFLIYRPNPTFAAFVRGVGRRLGRYVGWDQRGPRSGLVFWQKRWQKFYGQTLGRRLAGKSSGYDRGKSGQADPQEDRQQMADERGEG